MPITLDGTGGMTAPVGAIYNGLTLMTAQTSTSGTAIDFTGVPLWVKRITVMFSGVSTNGTSNWLVQLGSGSVTTSNYNAASMSFGNTSGVQSVYSAGFGIRAQRGSSSVVSGMMVITNITGATWVAQHTFGDGTNTDGYFGSGTITLSGSLDRLRVTTLNGTDTFDAGTINVMYE